MEKERYTITLSEHLKGVRTDLAKIILIVSELSKKISTTFHSYQGESGLTNMFGEEQIKMDRYADKVFIDGLQNSNLVKNIASEEQDSIISLEKSEGSYGITLDPLDGSSLVSLNLSVGTIVGFFDEGNVLEEGYKMDAALYLVYGPLTTLVYSAGNGVHEFILNDANEFVLKNENLKLPDGKIISPGGLRKDYYPYHQKYIESLESQGYKLRYSGAFVADLHTVLHKGGVFTYPATTKNPNGKLRLLFEANPMCFLIRQAGGAATTSLQRIENIRPRTLSERVPLYIGSEKDIQLIENIRRDFK